MNDHAQSMGRGGKEGQPNYRLCNSISKEEIRNPLRKMKTGKAVGPDGIPVKI